jgi:hypothetical protein
MLCRVSASGNGRVEKRNVRTLDLHQVRDALDSHHAHGAHLDPDRTRSESSEHALVARNRNDGIGVAHHGATIAARRAASAAVSATSPPRAARSRDAAGLRFQTIVLMPARKALVAIPWPMAPMPRTATGSCVDSIAPLLDVWPRPGRYSVAPRPTRPIAIAYARYPPAASTRHQTAVPLPDEPPQGRHRP